VSEPTLDDVERTDPHNAIAEALDCLQRIATAQEQQQVALENIAGELLYARETRRQT
jgi:hypothetical protein